MEWFRAYHGACSDPKWPIVARKAKVSVGVVVSIWFALLESASQAEDRGSVANFDPETVDALYGYEDGTAEAVLAALLEKGLIRDGRIRAWGKRQPKRERDDDSAARVRQHREKKRLETPAEAVSGHGDAGVAPCDASVTPPEQRREDKRIRIINTTRTPLSHAGNEDPAREREASRGSGRKAAPPTPPAEEPGIDFVELRRFYSEHFRDEGALAGFAEFRRARAGSRWPGFPRLHEHLNACLRCGQWEKGYAPGLARYLRERMWEDEPKPRALPCRASPARPGDFDPARQAQIFRDVLTDMEAEDAARAAGSREATQTGGAVCHGPELRQRVPPPAGATLDASA